MNGNELISVIVPVYQTEEYLDECIRSIAGQTYANLEIILVNDGSTDNCSRICESWAMQDSRIKVISQQNKGLSAARNGGFSVSTGRFISFVDSDDWLDSHFLGTLFANLKEKKADLAASGVIRFYQNGKESYPGLQKGVYSSQEVLETVISGTGFTVMVCNKLFKHEILAAHPFPGPSLYNGVKLKIE